MEMLPSPQQDANCHRRKGGRCQAACLQPGLFPLLSSFPYLWSIFRSLLLSDLEQSIRPRAQVPSSRDPETWQCICGKCEAFLHQWGLLGCARGSGCSLKCYFLGGATCLRSVCTLRASNLDSALDRTSMQYSHTSQLWSLGWGSGSKKGPFTNSYVSIHLISGNNRLNNSIAYSIENKKKCPSPDDVEKIIPNLSDPLSSRPYNIKGGGRKEEERES